MCVCVWVFAQKKSSSYVNLILKKHQQRGKDNLLSYVVLDFWNRRKNGSSLLGIVFIMEDSCNYEFLF